MFSNLDSKALKAPYKKTINPSKVRENYRLRLRKDKLSSVQREKRLQSYNNTFQAPSSYTINLIEIENSIDSSFISTYRSNQYPVEFILCFIDSFVSSQKNNQNINYIKFCLANLYQMTSTLKKDNKEIKKGIEQLFTKTRCSNLISLMCFPNIEVCLQYELSLIVGHLVCCSPILSLLFSCQDNISKIFNILANCSSNYPMVESILHIINNLLCDKECLPLIIANTSIVTYVLESIKMATQVPLSFITILFTTLGLIMTNDIVASKMKELLSIMPIIKNYLVTDINSSFFMEVLNCLSIFLQKLEKDDCEKGKACELYNAEFEILLDRYVETNADPIFLERIFNIYWSLSYLSDTFIESMIKYSRIFEKISNLLDYIITNPNSNPYLLEVLYSLLNFIFNVFTSKQHTRFILYNTQIVQDIIVILINNIVESALNSLILEILLKLIKFKDQTIITYLICIEFPKIVILSQLKNESLNANSQLIVLKMLDILMEYGERVLSDERNLLTSTFEQIGIGMLVEKMTGSKSTPVSEVADKIYRTYFKSNENY